MMRRLVLTGGGILIVATERIDLSGSLSAQGGTPEAEVWGGGGGGGGRIKLFAPAGDVLGTVNVDGGSGGGGSWSGDPGSDGTIHRTF